MQQFLNKLHLALLINPQFCTGFGEERFRIELRTNFRLITRFQ
jgi:hypothetical protein